MRESPERRVREGLHLSGSRGDAWGMLRGEAPEGIALLPTSSPGHSYPPWDPSRSGMPLSPFSQRSLYCSAPPTWTCHQPKWQEQLQSKGQQQQKNSCPFKCPLLPGQTHAPCKRYCSSAQDPICWGGSAGGNEGGTSAHHRNVGWQDGVLFHYKASLKPLSKQPSPKYACLSFSASASNCHPAPRRARNAEQADSQGEPGKGCPRARTKEQMGHSSGEEL